MEEHNSSGFNPLDWIDPQTEIKVPRNYQETASQFSLEPFQKQVIGTVNQMISDSANGQKHYVLCKASYLLGGYVSGGILNETLAVQTLQSAISTKANVLDLKLAYRTIDKCLESGKAEPITIEKLTSNQYQYWKKFDYAKFQNIETKTAPKSKSEKVPAFPIDIFPERITDLIIRANQTVGFPIDYFAASILYTASVAIGNSVKIKVRSTQYEAAILYFALVGQAGVSKSHPLKLAIKPIFEMETIYFKQYENEQEQYQIEHENYMNKSLKERKGESKPKEPIAKQILVSNSTIEALTEAHFYNHRGIGVYYDELIGWFNDFNKYKSNGSDEQFWLSTWNNTFVKINRKTGIKVMLIKYPFISVIGTIQTDLLKEIFKGNRGVNGFMDRMLFVMPEGLEKAKFNDAEIPTYLLDDYKSIINNLFNIEYEIENAEYQSKIVSFANDAKMVFKQWYDTNAELINNEKNEQLKSIYSKLDMYVPRFALIIQLLHCADKNQPINEVELFALNGAIQLAEYFRITATKIRSLVDNHSPPDEKTVVANFLKSQGKSLRDIGEVLNISHTQVNNLLKE